MFIEESKVWTIDCIQDWLVGLDLLDMFSEFCLENYPESREILNPASDELEYLDLDDWFATRASWWDLIRLLQRFLDTLNDLYSVIETPFNDYYVTIIKFKPHKIFNWKAMLTR